MLCISEAKKIKKIFPKFNNNKFKKKNKCVHFSLILMKCKKLI